MFRFFSRYRLSPVEQPSHCESPPNGYFTDRSMIRRIHREHVVGLGGPRALLMQAAHPVAFSGFFASTTQLHDPYPRLERTAAVINTIIFGARVDADRATARVRSVHSRMRGELTQAAGRFPAGTPWAADDPRLLLWIIATLAESSVLVYERYITGLRPDERERYWREFKVLGRLFGLDGPDMPETWPALRDYVRETLRGDDLCVTPQARELGIRIVLQPPVPLRTKPLLELANFITIGLLPAKLRRAYGLHWDPLRGLVHWGGAQYTRRLLMPVLPGRVRYAHA
jgi:uncharacterized protein (DUF2236 family)